MNVIGKEKQNERIFSGPLMNIEKFTADSQHKTFYDCNQQWISVDDVLEIMRNSIFQSGREEEYVIVEATLDSWMEMQRYAKN